MSTDFVARPPRRRWILGLALAFLVLASGLASSLAWRLSGAIMHPPVLAVVDAPERYGLKARRVNVTMPNEGLPLAGWFFRHPNDGGRAVLFIHGWGSHRQHMLHDYLRWLARDFTVLAFDLTNHGESPAGVTTLGAAERTDTRAALRFLHHRGYRNIGVYGMSMGGSLAIDLAAEDQSIRAVVTDGAFPRPAAVPAGYLREQGVPLSGLLGWWTAEVLQMRTGADLAGAAAITHVAAIAPRPLLLIHGEADALIPPADAQALYDAAGEPRTLWRLPRATHMSEAATSPHALAPEEYERRVEALFNAMH